MQRTATRNDPSSEKEKVAVSGSSGTSRGTDSWVSGAIGLLTLSGLLFSICAILVGFHHTLYDFHGFRQAQTALTARYLESGGSFLRYQTPILGPPWSIPFEFPLYQEIVAWTARHFGSSLEETGRAVSILFFYASFFPLASILRKLRFQALQIAVILALVACSPLYILVSRLFMIESTALFFSLAYLDQVFRLTIGPRRWSYTNMTLAAVFGSLAGLVKVTTFVPYFLLAVSVAAYQLWESRRTERLRFVQLSAVTFSCALVPLICTSLWTRFADAQKARNPIGVNMTSRALTAWNFGTLSQRLDPHSYQRLWENSYLQIGSTLSAVLIVAAYAVLVRRRNVAAFVCVALYALTVMTFFNLYYVHTYYSYGSALFLIVALGILISAILSLPGWKAWIGVFLLAMEMFVFFRSYRDEAYPLQARNAPGRADASALIDQTTGKNDIIIITGLAWSPELPYQSNRRAIMDAHVDHPFVPDNLGSFAREIEDVGPQTIPEVVACASARNSNRLHEILQLVDIAPAAPRQANDCDIYVRSR